MRLIVIFVLLTAYVNAQQYINYTTGNSDIAGNNISSIVIDNNGNIWAASDNGVSFFDGTIWKNFNEEGILKSNDISSLYFSDENTLWTASDSGASSFDIYNNNLAELNHLNSKNDSIVSDNIFSIVSDFLLSIWMGTDRGISVVTLQGIVNIDVTSGLKLRTNEINELAAQSDGWIYAATNGGGISRLKFHPVDGVTSASVVEKTWSALPSDTVFTVYIADDNQKFYGTNNGAASHYMEDSKTDTTWARYQTSAGLVNNRVKAITKDSEGNIWFGTEGGVSRFDGTEYVSFTEQNGLLSNMVNDIKADEDGALWVATDNGITKLVDITDITEQEHSLPESYIIELAAYPNPFNPSINFKIILNKTENLKLYIYDLQGSLVKTLSESSFTKGEHIINWDSRNDLNNKVNSGVYFVRAVTSNNSISKKILLLK